MTKEEKIRQCLSFIEGENFGKDTWRIISSYEYNSGIFLKNIKYYQELVENLKQSNVLEHPEDLIVSIEQHIILDVIMRLVILIEVLIILVDGLSSGSYKSIPNSMTYYNTESTYHYIKKIRNNQYNFRKILGLPQISKLPLEKEEQEYLYKLYHTKCEKYKELFVKLTNFYDKCRIIYIKISMD